MSFSEFQIDCELVLPIRRANISIVLVSGTELPQHRSISTMQLANDLSFSQRKSFICTLQLHAIGHTADITISLVSTKYRYELYLILEESLLN